MKKKAEGKKKAVPLIVALIILFSISLIASNLLTGMAASGQPDLLISNYSILSTNPVKGGIAIIGVTVKNQGAFNSEPTSLLLDVGLSRPWNFTLPSLAPSASYNFQVTPWLKQGSHSLAAYVDASNSNTEISKINNQISLSFNIGTVQNSTRVSALQLLPEPDLVITTLVFNPEQPITGETVGASITIQNIGTADANPSVLSVKGTRSGSWTLNIGALKPGETQTVSIPQLRPWFSLGIYTFTATVDATYKVIELDERNNNLQKTLVVSLPVLGISATTINPQGNLTVISNPDGGTVYVDNQYKGTAPIVISGLSTGRHTVNVTYPLYLPYSTEVTIDINTPLTLSADLDPTDINLTINSLPTGASAYVDNSPVGNTPIITETGIGQRTVKISKHGYLDYETTLTLTGNYTLIANLTPIPLNLSISSSPSGASILLDDVNKGSTPLTVTAILGVHQIKLTHPGYYDSTSTINLTANNSLAANLVAIPFNLSVSSVPSGAVLYLDDVNKGNTPLTVTTFVGVHQLKLTKSGYYDYTSAVNISTNYSLTETLSSVPLNLSVSSTPSGAAVYLDNVNKGNTPIVITTSAGSHQLKITKTNYYEDISTVTLTNANLTVSKTLSIIPGSIYILSTPNGAAVYLDGTYKGVSPIIIPSVAVGSHTVKLTLNTYYDYTTTVTVNSNQQTNLYPPLVQKPTVLSITSDPSGAQIYVDNVYKGLSPASITLQPGTRVYTLKLTNYGDYSETVALSAGTTTTKAVTMPKLNSHAYIYSDQPGSTYKFSRNGYGQTDAGSGTTPGATGSLAGGTLYYAVVSAPGFFDNQQTLYTSGNSPFIINAQMQPLTGSGANSGTLIIDSTPTNSNLYLNGMAFGTTPATLQLNEGQYSYTVSNPSYRDATGSFSITKGRTSTVQATLPYNYWYIYVFSNPSGASVTVSYWEPRFGTHTLTGTTPYATQYYSGTTYTVIVSKPGYQPSTYTVGSTDGAPLVVNG